MLIYQIPLVPGPTRVPESVRQAYLTDYASADLEPEYSQLYADVSDGDHDRSGTWAPRPAWSWSAEAWMATPIHIRRQRQ